MEKVPLRIRAVTNPSRPWHCPLRPVSERLAGCDVPDTPLDNLVVRGCVESTSSRGKLKANTSHSNLTLSKTH